MRTERHFLASAVLALVIVFPIRETMAASTSLSLESKAAAVRAAIHDLIESFGPRYPNGGQFLQQLENLAREPGAEEEFLNWERQALLANPLLRDHPILFVARRQYTPDHHNTATFFPKASTEYNDGKFQGGSALKLIDLARGGEVQTLIDLPDGIVRDPEVHFSGSRMVVSLRRSKADSYHIFEVDRHGAMRQLTHAEDVDDLDPAYLPDDTIVFSSTREPKYCMCNRHIMANLYRMEADGANIHKVGNSTLFEGHASVMPDGRILYDRWEYVDRNFGDAQALWTVNPDGSNHAVYWGNNTAAPGAIIDGRAIPGTERVIAVFGSCHDRPWGALAILDRRLGLDGAAPVVRLWPSEAFRLVREEGWETFDAFTSVKLKYEDPCPLFDPAIPGTAGKYFLCSRMTGIGEQTGIYLIDVFGNELLVHSEAPGCFDPMPLAPHPRPPILTPRREFQTDEGVFYVQDVYRGTHMRGVQRGSVRFLRVIESPEKRFWTRPSWGGQGQEAPAMNWHDFNNKRILGTVPVEADGSAAFSVPAEKFVYFQLLDDRGTLVQSMRSGTLVQAGEHQGCVGCHENRRQAPPAHAARYPLAFRRTPSRLQEWKGPTRLFSYVREVQPVFDQHCVRCHDYGQDAGRKLNLAGDSDLVFNTSYIELWHKGYVKVIGAGPAQIQDARSWGSRQSRLIDQMCGANRGVQLSEEDWDRIVTWIDLNAPFYPSYSSAFPDNLAGRCPLTPTELERLEQLTSLPFRNLAAHSSSRGPQISFDRPELSPCLARLPGGKEAPFREALAIIQAGQRRLREVASKSLDEAPGCAIDEWRERNYLRRQETEARNRRAIREGTRRYDTEVESSGRPNNSGSEQSAHRPPPVGPAP